MCNKNISVWNLSTKKRWRSSAKCCWNSAMSWALAVMPRCSMNGLGRLGFGQKVSSNFLCCFWLARTSSVDADCFSIGGNVCEQTIIPCTNIWLWCTGKKLGNSFLRIDPGETADGKQRAQNLFSDIVTIIILTVDQWLSNALMRTGLHDAIFKGNPIWISDHSLANFNQQIAAFVYAAMIKWTIRLSCSTSFHQLYSFLNLNRDTRK